MFFPFFSNKNYNDNSILINVIKGMCSCVRELTDENESSDLSKEVF